MSANRGVGLYCHPEQLARKPFRREFDQFSLGCVLLEIGRWGLLKDWRIASGWNKDREGGDDAWRAEVVAQAKRLGGVMGRIYTDVVVSLLESVEWEEGDFWEDVVLKLKDCNA